MIFEDTFLFHKPLIPVSNICSISMSLTICSLVRVSLRQASKVSDGSEIYVRASNPIRSQHILRYLSSTSANSKTSDTTYL